MEVEHIGQQRDVLARLGHLTIRCEKKHVCDGGMYWSPFFQPIAFLTSGIVERCVRCYNSLMRIVNKKGLHNYQILESLEAGVVLHGNEVKSIRAGRVDLSESFARIVNEEAVLVNTLIPAYQNAPIKDYNPTRTRKLLLHKEQIRSIIGKLTQAKLTLVPIAIYDKNNLIKVEIGLAKSKKQFDKRKELKERDNIRREEQELRGKE